MNRGDEAISNLNPKLKALNPKQYRSTKDE